MNVGPPTFQSILILIFTKKMELIIYKREAYIMADIFYALADTNSLHINDIRHV